MNFLHNKLAYMETINKSCFSIGIRMCYGLSYDPDFVGEKNNQKQKTWRPHLHEEVSGSWLCHTVLCKYLRVVGKKTPSQKTFIDFRERWAWIFRYQS